MPQYQAEKHYGKTSILWKSELFIRQYLIPYDIARRLELSAGSDAVTKEFERIQVTVDVVELRTNHCSFSLDDAKLLFHYLCEGPLNDEPGWIKHFIHLREKHKKYDAYLKKVLEQRKKKKAIPERQDILRSPWFILGKITETDLTACCNHFYQYFKVFEGERRFGVRFDFNSELNLHLVACKSDFDDSVLTVIAESIDKCCGVDTRSVFQGHKHAFGVGSFVSHGCPDHITVELPNIREGTYIRFAKKARIKRARDSYFAIRCNYGKTYFNKCPGVKCDEENCFSRIKKQRR